jgi:GTPase Era involved in 16S rRNA processing
MMPHDDAIIRQLYNDQWKSPANAYRLNIGLIGPVNSGKSELLARLSHKISAVSPKVNTTSEILHSYKSFEL